MRNLLLDMDPVLLKNSIIVYIGGYNQQSRLFGKIAYIPDQKGNKIINNRPYTKNPFPFGDVRWNRFKEIIETEYPELTCNFDLDPHVVSFSKEEVVYSPDPFEVYSEIQKHNSQLSYIFNYLSDKINTNLGVIGSLCLGSRTYGDIDILVEGKENFEELCMSLQKDKQVRSMQEQELIKKQIHEYAEIFPRISKDAATKMIKRRSLSRFFIKDKEISLWVRYTEHPSICFYETPYTGSEERIQMEVLLSDDTLSEYFPVILKEEEELDGIILFNRFFRGAFRKGDKLFVDGTKVRFHTKKEDLEFLLIDYKSSIEFV